MSILSNFSAIEQAVQQLFQPKPTNYNNHQIFKIIHEFNSTRALNNGLNLLKCKFLSASQCQDKNIQKFPTSYLISSQNVVSDKEKVCVIYLHGFSSYCFEGLYLIPHIAKMNNYSLCLYDLQGHGKNLQNLVTFGIQQTKQLQRLIRYLHIQEKFSNIIIWGRSMGATTSLHYLMQEKSDLTNIVKAVISDSAFSSFQTVCGDIINNNMSNVLPKFITDVLTRIVFQKAKQKYKLDLSTLNVIHNKKKRQQTLAPVIFVSSSQDEIILQKNTEIIMKNYPCSMNKYQCKCIHIKGSFTHNQQRPAEILSKIFTSIEQVMQKANEQNMDFRDNNNTLLKSCHNKYYNKDQQVMVPNPKKGINLYISTINNNQRPLSSINQNKPQNQISNISPKSPENVPIIRQLVNNQKRVLTNTYRPITSIKESQTNRFSEFRQNSENMLTNSVKIKTKEKIKTIKKIQQEQKYNYVNQKQQNKPRKTDRMRINQRLTYPEQYNFNKQNKWHKNQQNKHFYASYTNKNHYENNLLNAPYLSIQNNHNKPTSVPMKMLEKHGIHVSSYRKISFQKPIGTPTNNNRMRGLSINNTPYCSLAPKNIR